MNVLIFKYFSHLFVFYSSSSFARFVIDISWQVCGTKIMINYFMNTESNFYGSSSKIYLNPFQAKAFFLYPLKRLENLWCSDMFSREREETLTWNGIRVLVQLFINNPRTPNFTKIQQNYFVCYWHFENITTKTFFCFFYWKSQ